MREIKFRGISTYNNEWVKGGYLRTVFKDNTDDHKIYPLLYNVNPHTIKIETLGQLTGLTDKNGIEIYEGDILNHPNSGNFEVKFDVTGFYIFYKSVKQVHIITEHMDIIGNIHENPELL